MVDPERAHGRRLRSGGSHRLRLRPGRRARLHAAARQSTDIREFYKNDVRFLAPVLSFTPLAAEPGDNIVYSHAARSDSRP